MAHIIQMLSLRHGLWIDGTYSSLMLDIYLVDIHIIELLPSCRGWWIDSTY